MTTGDAHQAARDQDDGTTQAQETHTLVDALTRGQRRRIDAMDTKFDRKLHHLEDRVDTGLELVATRLDQVDGRLVGADARIDGLEERLTDRLEGLETTLGEVLRRLPDADA